MSAVRLTHHGRDRLRRRMGLSGGAPRRMADRVYREGVPIEHLGGQLRSYADGQINRHKVGTESRIYGETLWVFEAGALITAYPVPHRLRAAARDAWAKHRREA